MYAGLRRGALQALRWSDVDLAGGVIHVQRSWDAKEGFTTPKSVKGIRRVPIAAVLCDHLVEHRMTSDEPATDGLVFGRSTVSPFAPHGVTARADTAWTAAKLDRILLHPLEYIRVVATDTLHYFIHPWVDPIQRRGQRHSASRYCRFGAGQSASESAEGSCHACTHRSTLRPT
jgi:hypothetical protein